MTIKELKSLIERSVTLDVAKNFEVCLEVDDSISSLVYSKKDRTLKLTQTGRKTLTVEALLKYPDNTTILLPWYNIWYTPSKLKVYKKYDSIYIDDSEKALTKYIKDLQQIVKLLINQIEYFAQ